jgi:broad specificity phosphatase PhoE
VPGATRYGRAVGVKQLLLVRHGESLGNVAREQAVAANADVIEIDRRDADVDLSELGEQQADALGHWLAAQPETERPQAVWSSPYVRALDTARRAVTKAGLDVPFTVDERLRDRELGVLDLLTGSGVNARFPDEARRRSWLGKLYYRPPGGESWADVVLRLRSVLLDLEARAGVERVLISTHDAIILLFRYVCEELDERALLDLAAHTSVVNASVTRIERRTDADRWQVTAFNESAHLEERGVAPTEHPGNQDVHAD